MTDSVTLNEAAKLEAAGFATPEPVQEEEPKIGTDVQEETQIPELPEDPVKRAEAFSDMLKGISDNAPGAEQLMAWKAQCGSVLMLMLFDKAYLYRPIRRQEYSVLMKDEAFNNLSQLEREEHIVGRCLLWPKFSPVQKAASEAGLFTTLFNEIQTNSMFIDPQTCAALTIKL